MRTQKTKILDKFFLNESGVYNIVLPYCTYHNILSLY